MTELKHPVKIIRIWEFVFSALTLGILRAANCNSFHNIRFVHVITISFVVISAYTLIALLIREDVGRISFGMLASFCSASHIAVGVIMIEAGVEKHCPLDYSVASATFALLNGLVYLTDVILIIRSLWTEKKIFL